MQIEIPKNRFVHEFFKDFKLQILKIKEFEDKYVLEFDENDLKSLEELTNLYPIVSVNRKIEIYGKKFLVKDLKITVQVEDFRSCSIRCPFCGNVREYVINFPPTTVPSKCSCGVFVASHEGELDIFDEVKRIDENKYTARTGEFEIVALKVEKNLWVLFLKKLASF